MRIREIIPVGLRGGTPLGGWTNELSPTDCIHTLIAVVTEDGLVGWGSSSTTDKLAAASLEVIRPLLGETITIEPDRISDEIDRESFWLGHGGALTHTSSGLDIALWDLLGQTLGEPVARLLGGCHRRSVVAYASILMQNPASLRQELGELKSRGFQAFKIGWGQFGRVSSAIDEELIATSRDTIGPEALLMVDAGGSDGAWSASVKWAMRTSEMLAAYGVSWLEEPLRTDAIDGYVDLRRMARVPIAAGEVLTRRASFFDWISRGALDIVQPDTTKCGGLSVARRVGWLAEDHGMRLIPHGWGTAVGLAADLHLSSSLSGTDMVEYRPGAPYIDQLADWQVSPAGRIDIPDRPGLGLEIRIERLRPFIDERTATKLAEYIAT